MNLLYKIYYFFFSYLEKDDGEDFSDQKWCECDGEYVPDKGEISDNLTPFK